LEQINRPAITTTTTANEATTANWMWFSGLETTNYYATRLSYWRVRQFILRRSRSAF